MVMLRRLGALAGYFLWGGGFFSRYRPAVYTLNTAFSARQRR